MTTTKIFKVRDHLCAYTDSAAQGEEVLEWFLQGACASNFPASQRDKENWSGLLVITPAKIICRYEQTPYPVIFEGKIFAAGSGRDFALMAMHLGKTAPEAVELTSLFENGCGNGVDCLTLG